MKIERKTHVAYVAAANDGGNRRQSIGGGERKSASAYRRISDNEESVEKKMKYKRPTVAK